MFQIFLAIAGKVLDLAVQYSIVGAGFSNFNATIQSVWTIARDTCNIAFIFVLLYIAIQQIIGSIGTALKGKLASIVIAALFINFSLFLTGLVIDAGNIVAVALLNQITLTQPSTNSSVKGGALDNLASGITGSVESVPLSENIMDNLGLVNVYQQSATLSTLLNVGPAEFITAVIRLVLFLITMFIFLFMAILIIGRFVMLIFLMAISPIGFMGGTVPFLADAAKKWQSELISQTLVAPVFIFFMLLIIKVSQTIVKLPAGSITPSSDQVGGNIVIYFNYIFIIYLLIKAVEITKKLSGELGDLANKAATATAGLALGAATGGTALLARQSVGRIANKVGSNDRLRMAGYDIDEKGNAKNKSGALALGARTLFRTGILGSKASMDIRNTGAAKETLGFIKGQGVDIAGSHAKGAEGGYAGAIKRATDDKAKFAKEHLDRKNLSDSDALIESEKKLPGIQNEALDALAKGINASNNLAIERAKGASADQKKIAGYLKDIDKYQKEERGKTALAGNIKVATQRNPATGELMDTPVARKAREDVVRYIKGEARRGYENLVENSPITYISGEYKEAAKQLRKDLGENLLADLTKILSSMPGFVPPATPGGPAPAGPATPAPGTPPVAGPATP